MRGYGLFFFIPAPITLGRAQTPRIGWAIRFFTPSPPPWGFGCVKKPRQSRSWKWTAAVYGLLFMLTSIIQFYGRMVPIQKKKSGNSPAPTPFLRQNAFRHLPRMQFNRESSNLNHRVCRAKVLRFFQRTHAKDKDPA